MGVVYQDQAVQLIQGDVLTVLKTLPDHYVQSVITSPPYWGLRDYKIPPQVWGGLPACKHRWQSQTKQSGGAYKAGSKKRWQHSAEDFTRDDRFLDGHPKIPAGSTCAKCGAWRGSLGLEPTIELYVRHVVDVFREVRRVLRKDGTCFLNIGDTYHQGNKGQSGAMKAHYKQASNIGSLATRRGDGLGPNRTSKQDGLKPKDRCGIPHRIIFALQADGWWWRDEIVWHKNNPMPSSAKDRCTMSHEFLFMLTKSARYIYDYEAIKEQASGTAHARGNGVNPKAAKWPENWDESVGNGGHGAFHRLGREGKNSRFHQDRDPHHSTGRKIRPKQNASFSAAVNELVDDRMKRSVWEIATQPFPEAHFATFPEALIEPCILAGAPIGGLVLDPFSGAATTLLVAKKLNRKGLGIELSEAYCAMSAKRLQLEPARLL